MSRLLLIAAPSFGLVGLVFYISVAGPYLLTHQPRLRPEQPIAFDHQVHAQQLGLECAFCHRTADQATTAGYPDVEQCMFCHQTVGSGQPEIERLREAWIEQHPIDWERVHRLPDHVHFPHDAHVQAGVDCATCHGDVASMSAVRQVRPLNMRDCVECHRQTDAPSECGVCHY